MLQIAAPLLTIGGNFFTIYRPYRTKLYICTDGLLKIYKKKDEAIRWDEVKELYTTGGNVAKMVKQDGNSFELPSLLMSGRSKTINTLISDEVTRYLLPSILAKYERGEAVKFGYLEVNQKGIYRLGDLVYWDQLGDIALEKGQLSAYYSEKTRKKNSQGSNTHTWKWHIWQKSSSIRAPWPNLPVLVALVNHVLDQQDTNYIQETPLSQNIQSLKETAIIAKYKDRRRKRVTIVAIIAAILGIFSLCISLIVYQSVEEQRRVDRDIQLIRNYVKMMAHKPYYAHVPGQHCDHGKGYWYDDSTNVYTCQKDGLLMTQKNMQYQDEIVLALYGDQNAREPITALFSDFHYTPYL